MMIGLLRWPTLQWRLAQEWMASPASREQVATQFATANLYLGNVTGEFAGEMFLNAFLLAAALNNTVLPIWMLVLGLTLIFTTRRHTSA